MTDTAIEQSRCYKTFFMIQIKIQTFDQYGDKSHIKVFKIEEKEIKKVISICKTKMKQEREEQLNFHYMFGVPKPQFPDIVIMFNGKEIKTKWRNYNKNDLFWLNAKQNVL